MRCARGARNARAAPDLRRPRRDDARRERRRSRRAAGRHPAADLRGRGRRQPALPVQAPARPAACSSTRSSAALGDETYESYEGCLSIPDLRGLLPRAHRGRGALPRSRRQRAPRAVRRPQRRHDAARARPPRRHPLPRPRRGSHDALHLGDVPRLPPGGVGREHRAPSGTVPGRDDVRAETADRPAQPYGRRGEPRSIVLPRCPPSPTSPARAALRPVPGPPARAPLGAPRRRGRDLGQARGLQLGARLRRQQGAQARVPRRRRARAGLRHARLDRRRPVEPHATGRRGRRPPRARLRARAGALGRLGRPGLRPGRQHPALADHGRRRAAVGRRLRHRLPAELGGGARPRSRRAAASRTRSRPAPPTTRSAGTGSRAGPTRWPTRRRSSASSSTRSSSARSPARRRPG